MELLYFCLLFLLFYVIRDKNQDCSSEKKFPVFDERNIQQPSTEKPLLGIWIPDQSNTVDFEKLIFMERGNPEYWRKLFRAKAKNNRLNSLTNPSLRFDHAPTAVNRPLSYPNILPAILSSYLMHVFFILPSSPYKNTEVQSTRGTEHG